MNTCQQNEILDVASEGFDHIVTRSPIPVLVNFETSWSKQMLPLRSQLAESFRGRLRIVQVDISADHELARRFKIRAVPTLLIFKKGIPIEFIVGTVPSRFVFETVFKTLGVCPYSTAYHTSREDWSLSDNLGPKVRLDNGLG
jgi:thioredoxin